jgi:tRNA dimethylallyltransferase
MKHLIIIGGPTASGKTALSLRLAKHYGTEILSADSRQFYREMSIGTAKPSSEELAAVRHHFIDSLSVTDVYSAGDFERDALVLLEKLFKNHDVVLLVGGAGLFIQAVAQGLDDFPAITPEVRTLVAEGEQNGGLGWLQEQVALKDPAYYAVVDRQNPARLRRALAVCLQSGLPYSQFRNNQGKSRPFLCHYLLLEWPRDVLYQRIDARVDTMIEAGLEDEVKRLLPYRDKPALRTVGYEEFFSCLDGDCTYAEAVDKIKQHSRNYAKRQLTWFKKRGEWSAFHPENTEGIQTWLKERLGF